MEEKKPLDISYTMLHSFMQCEYMYYLRYVKRIKLAESSASVFGTVVHQTIKEAYDNNMSEDEMAKYFRREWVAMASAKDVVFDHDKEYLAKLQKGKTMVKDYHKKYLSKEQPPKATEIFIARKSGVKLGRHNVIAVFDQISADDYIIDYKTGVKPTKMQLDLDLQFTLYSYVYRQLYGKEEAGLILRHLGTMKDLETTRCNEDFDVLLNEVNKLDDRMSSGVFLRNLDRGCANCYFLEHCLGKERISRWSRW